MNLKIVIQYQNKNDRIFFNRLIIINLTKRSLEISLWHLDIYGK